MMNKDLSNDTVIHIKSGNGEYIQFKKLLQYKNIISHAYSVGIDKSYRTSKPNREKLERSIYEKNFCNYNSLCKEINLDSTKLIKANQAHTDIILCIDKIDMNDTIDTIEPSDALVTNKNKLVLATTNADCILFLMFDPIKKVIANVHSGWKGTLQEISVKTVKKMQEKYGCNPRDIIVCICPSIRQCHFEVDEDVKEMFSNQFGKIKNEDEFIQKENKKWHIDTVLINKIILNQAGISEENIEDSRVCSVCNGDKIHSYREEGKEYGLASAIIGLV